MSALDERSILSQVLSSGRQTPDTNPTAGVKAMQPRTTRFENPFPRPSTRKAGPLARQLGPLAFGIEPPLGMSPWVEALFVAVGLAVCFLLAAVASALVLLGLGLLMA